MIQITNPADCCGCTACASICNHNAITMQPDSEGFLYPKINKNICIDCGLCTKVCPVLHRKNREITSNQLGYFALRNKSKKMLEKSSSGGAFIAIATYIIRQGGVVCGAQYSENGEVVHEFSESIDGIIRFMGSKYVQSNITGIYKKVKVYLSNDKLVLFTGTPCQVEGLKLYLRGTYNNLITLDLVCHAVPSPMIYKKYIEYCSKKLGSSIVSIDMRYKQTYGWSHKFAYRFILRNGKQIVEPSVVENWGRLYFSQLINRPSCHDCKFTNYNRSGDMTIADFWDDNKKRPDIYSKEGTSLLLINTEQGMALLEAIKDSVDIWTITKEESNQPCLLRPTPPNTERNAFWRYYYQKGFLRTYRKYFTDDVKTYMKKKVKKLIRSIYGYKNTMDR